MRKDKKSAIKLRNKGKSYSQISEVLGIPKSTLSEWFSQEEWSLKIKLKLKEKNNILSKERIKSLNVSRQIKLEELYLRADQEAEKEFKKHKDNSLFISGVMLYWGEGDKKFENGQVKVSNTNAYIIRIFRNFLIKFGNYPLEKIKGWILIYPDLNPTSCVSYWATKTGILRSNFVKPTTIQGRHKTNRLSYGTCTIYVANKYLKRKVLRWIDLFKKELVVLKLR